MEKKYNVIRRFGDNDGILCCNGDLVACSKFYKEMRQLWSDSLIREDDEHFVFFCNGREESFHLILCGPASKSTLVRLYDQLSIRFSGKTGRLAKANLSMSELNLVSNLGVLEITHTTTIREILNTLKEYLKL